MNAIQRLRNRVFPNRFGCLPDVSTNIGHTFKLSNEITFLSSFSPQDPYSIPCCSSLQHLQSTTKVVCDQRDLLRLNLHSICHLSSLKGGSFSIEVPLYTFGKEYATTVPHVLLVCVCVEPSSWFNCFQQPSITRLNPLPQHD